MSEHKIQNEVRNALAGKSLVFRANVGRAWAGDVEKLKTGKLLISNPRPFDTGLPPGFSDLFGISSVVITPEMVGKKVAVFTALEVKQPGKKPSALQQNFINAVKFQGGIAGVVTCADDAVQLIEKGLK